MSLWCALFGHTLMHRLWFDEPRDGDDYCLNCQRFYPDHPAPEGPLGPLNFRLVSRPNPCAPPPGLEARLEERT